MVNRSAPAIIINLWSFSVRSRINVPFMGPKKRSQSSIARTIISFVMCANEFRLQNEVIEKSSEREKVALWKQQSDVTESVENTLVKWGNKSKRMQESAKPVAMQQAKIGKLFEYKRKKIAFMKKVRFHFYNYSVGVFLWWDGYRDGDAKFTSLCEKKHEKLKSQKILFTRTFMFPANQDDFLTEVSFVFSCGHKGKFCGF